MNAGAYGGELKDAVESVVCYYLPEQRLYEVPGDKCDFGYRSSFFKKLPGCVVLSAVLRLEAGDREEIAAKMRDFNQRRRDKQPLDLPSAGSAFKRPEGQFAAALIDQAGLKGFRVGGAQVSEKHAGFVVNAGGASAHDVHELMLQVRKTVYEKSGIILEPEIIILPPDYKLEDNGPGRRRAMSSAVRAAPRRTENGISDYNRPFRRGQKPGGGRAGGSGLLLRGQHARGAAAALRRALPRDARAL